LNSDNLDYSASLMLCHKCPLQIDQGDMDRPKWSKIKPNKPKR